MEANDSRLFTDASQFFTVINKPSFPNIRVRQQQQRDGRKKITRNFPNILYDTLYVRLNEYK